jgi:hypothetical protein
MAEAPGYLLFVPSSHGYEIVEREDEAPPAGEEIELDGQRFVVTKLGPSPYPGDERRCAYLQAVP